MIKINNLLDHFFPDSYNIIFLHAHADDESFLSAGLIKKLVSLKKKVTILYTASGIVKNNPKTRLRQNEATKAASILGVKNILFLNFCDYQYVYDYNNLSLTNYDKNQISNLLLSFLKNNNLSSKFIFLSYDKNGGYGHIDHRIVNTIGNKLKENKHTIYEITMNRNIILDWIDNDRNKQLSYNMMPEKSYWSSVPWLNKKEVTHYYKLDREELIYKRNALSVHRSQMKLNEFPLSLQDKDFSKIFGYEYLKIL